MPENTIRVGLYARVSTADQDCEMQLIELRQYATARGWTVVGEYVDTGWSGKNADRPALKRCIADARGRKFDAVAVWKLDRWGRTVQQLVNDILDFDSAGIRFIAITQSIDTDATNPMSRLLLHILAAFAEWERSIIKERVACGMKKAQKIGTKSGKPIGRPVIIVDRKAVWDRRAEGATLSELQDEFGLTRGTVQRLIGIQKQQVAQDKQVA